VGAVLEVTERQAAELVSIGKARRAADEPAAPPRGPLTTESAGEIVAGSKRKKGDSHAL
jgi:hypothetical protein